MATHSGQRLSCPLNNNNKNETKTKKKRDKSNTLVLKLVNKVLAAYNNHDG